MKPCVNEYFTELKNYVSKTFGISLNPIPLRDKTTFIISTQRYPDRISPHMVMNEDVSRISSFANDIRSGLKITNGRLLQNVIYLVKEKCLSCIVTSNVTKKLTL
mmetsp:Transcript_4144/g.4739  ORF Transcript_4144/g.4739 Transcript_4144/m.4739 type:complete len:105 (+) Transcript_4144:523-837(+)